MKLVIGLDAGARFGIAKYVDGKLQGLELREPWGAFRMLDALPKRTTVVMEDSRLQSHVWSARSVNAAARMKIARNVGEIDGYCRVVDEICRKAGLTLVCISPKDKGEKVDSAEFQQLTGWQSKSNQHVRDAAMVAWRYRGGLS